MTLRLLSYLAPSLPTGLFETIAAWLSSELGSDVELTFDPSRSGPRPREHEPFSTGEVDLAFLCATSYVWLTTARQEPAVELIGAAWAPIDPRSAGRPVYFGDVLAPQTGVRSLTELAGKRIAYNDDVSLSGYHSLRLALSAAGINGDVNFVRSGSHLTSLELLVTGQVDAAAIDSNVWRRRRRETPGLARQLSPIAALGPHPVQPLVSRASLSPRLREAVRDALLAANVNMAVTRSMNSAEFARFVPISDIDFHPLRAQLTDFDVAASANPDACSLEGAPKHVRHGARSQL